VRREEQIWASLRFPREVSETQGLAVLVALNGHSTPSRREAMTLEVVGRPGEISYRLAVPKSRAAAIHEQLQTAIPGLSVEVIDRPELVVDRAWRAWQSNKARSLSTDRPEVIAQAILTALAAAKGSESVVLQWMLGPVRRPTAVGTQVRGDHGSNLLTALAKAPFIPPADLDSEARGALRVKQSLPGWRAVLSIGVHADGTPRQRQLLGGLAAALRAAQGPGVELGFDGVRPTIVQERYLPWRWSVVANVAELLGLSGLPLGDTGHLPVPRVRSRLLPPSRALWRKGYILGESSYPGQERPLALPIEDSLKHLHVVGSTGTGKSTVALHFITQAMEAGRSVVVIEPKDLVNDVLARVPRDRLDDVVLVDPASDPVVGFNPLVQPGVPPELVADQVLGVFKGLFGEAIGPRTQDILTAGLLTLLAQPVSSGARTLVALPLLFTDRRFRARLLKNIRDPIGIAPFWAWWDGLSTSEQSSALAPPMNKLRAFLVRAPLRRTIGQGKPKFDPRDIFSKRPITLFNLRRGSIGAESANLLASLAMSMIWQTAQGRAAVAVERRHPVLLVADEFQDFTHLGQDFGDILVQARGLGLSLVLSHQHLGQLSDRPLKAAVINNARSRLIFATGHDDAAQLVKTDSRLKPEDVTGLGAFEAYASILTGNETQPFASLRTLPPPAATIDPDEVRRHSSRRWGVDAAEIDRELERLIGQSPASKENADEASFGVRRRRSKAEGQP
jgi:hypothetical protein